MPTSPNNNASTAPDMGTTTTVSARQRRWKPQLLSIVCLVSIPIALVIGVCIGAINVGFSDTLSVIAHHLGLTSAPVNNTLADTIVWDIRMPRVLLALIVGSMLAGAGCAYQGTFRNPLADPYLLGISAGAGLGATVHIVLSHQTSRALLPMFAFSGAMLAVAITYALGRSAISGRSSVTLILAGVAVANLLTALQTLVQQRNADKVREVYSWILGRLNTSSWSDVRLIAPYVAVCLLALIALRRVLDVFAVGDEEAKTLGLPLEKARAIVIVAASLGTAAAVSVTGLIGFVGIIVPHVVRLINGTSYRSLLPLSIGFGGVFLVGTDLIARTALAPEEIPIGVITALIGAPLFLFVLSSHKRGGQG